MTSNPIWSDLAFVQSYFETPPAVEEIWSGQESVTDRLTD